jgi:hypothetical protein
LDGPVMCWARASPSPLPPIIPMSPSAIFSTS